MSTRVYTTAATTLYSASFGRRLGDENGTFAPFTSLSAVTHLMVSLSLSLDIGRYSYYVCMEVIAFRIILVLRSTNIEKKTKCESVKENDYNDNENGGGSGGGDGD